MGMTFGWSRPAAMRDSRRNRSRNASSSLSSGASSFSATVRPSERCSAGYTMLMPPWPSNESSRYPANSEPMRGTQATPTRRVVTGGPNGRYPLDTHSRPAACSGPVPERTSVQQAIETLLLEERRYPPPPEFAAQANAQPAIYERGFDEFWETEARQRVAWSKSFETLYEWDLPFAKWFVGGKLNVCFNCVDRHVDAGRGDQVAYYWEGEPEDDRRVLTFADLQADVVRFANALKDLGVRNGTPVAIYMGMVPELPIAMLACARVGAPFTVVFGGFSADSLAGRLNDMGCEVLLTQDEGWRRGAPVPLKRNADAALAESPSVRRVVVLRRTGGPVWMDESRDVWWHEALEGKPADPGSCPCEEMD